MQCCCSGIVVISKSEHYFTWCPVDVLLLPHFRLCFLVTPHALLLLVLVQLLGGKPLRIWIHCLFLVALHQSMLWRGWPSCWAQQARGSKAGWPCSMDALCLGLARTISGCLGRQFLFVCRFTQSLLPSKGRAGCGCFHTALSLQSTPICCCITKPPCGHPLPPCWHCGSDFPELPTGSCGAPYTS